MKIAVRLDDITPDMDWERFEKFKALLDKYQVKPLIGLVPDNRDALLKGDKPAKESQWYWNYIQELQEQGWSLAMHGCYHTYTTSKGGLFPLNHFSEFAGEPLEKQRELIHRGKKILSGHGINTSIFMAPGHSYDRNTLRALQENGFTEITDGFGTRPYYFKGMTFYPISFLLRKTFQAKQGYSTMVVHTGTVSDEDLKTYEQYFQREEIQWISFEEYRRCKPVSRGILGRGKEYFLAVGKGVAGRLRNR